MTMQAKTWRVLEQALEAGFGYGVRRFFKYRDSAICNEADLRLGQDTFVQAMMTEIADWFDFPEPPDHDVVEPGRELKRRRTTAEPPEQDSPKEGTYGALARSIEAQWLPDVPKTRNPVQLKPAVSHLGRGLGCRRRRVRPQMPGIIDIIRVGQIVGMAPTSIRRLMARTDLPIPFPPGRKLSAHKRIWIEQDVLDWMNRMTAPDVSGEPGTIVGLNF